MQCVTLAPAIFGMTLPLGWAASSATTPEMSAEVDSTPWIAISGSLALRVTWRVHTAQYVCEVIVETSVVETAWLAYPHEVTEWLTTWFRRAR